MNRLRILVVMVPLALAGCPTPPVLDSGPQLPTASAGFIPRTSYQMSSDAMFSAVLRALALEEIPVATSSKEQGQITTGYVSGPSGKSGSAFFVLTTQTVRYKYNIFIVSTGRNTTQLTIKAVLESSAVVNARTSTVLPFNDVSAANQTTVVSLQNALYEKIQPSLK